MKATTVVILIAGVCIAGFIILFTLSKNPVPGQAHNGNNVSMVDGRQIIEIRAKGGYQPRKSIAQAGVPTIIRFNTNGTFDCSASVRIPSMNINKVFPNTGVTDIDIGTQTVGVLQGTCGMGMYPFEINFQTE